MDKKGLREAIKKEVLVRATPERPIIAPDGGVAPWLFDFRALLLQPRWLDAYAELFWETYADRYPFQVCAMESAGISLVSAIIMKSLERKRPVNGLYVRKSRKREGLMKQLEGVPTKDPVILVDDLVHSGATFQRQIDVLDRAGIRVDGMFALLSFLDPSSYSFSRTDARVSALFSLKDFGVSTEKGVPKRPQLVERWRFAASGAAFQYVMQKSSPAIDDERVYFGTDAGTLYALRQDDGSIAWSFATGNHPPGKGIFSSPALHGGNVYFGAYDGNVYALDARTGEKRWSYEDADWVGSSPAVAPELGVLFIGLEFGLFNKRGGIVALHADTGERLWEARSTEYTHGSPLYIKEKNLVVVGSNDDTVYAFEADTGKPRWQYQTNGSVKASFAYDAKRDLLVFGSLGGILYALSSDGDLQFLRELGAGVYSTPLVSGDVAYITSLDKHLYALELSAGKILWRYRTEGRIFASPILIDGRLYTGSNDGCLHEIEPETGVGAAVFRTTERIVNRIAYDEKAGRFFVPTVANEIYCLRRER